jgi:hypothetical protein
VILLNRKEIKFETFPNGETKLIKESMIDSINLQGDNVLYFKYEDDSVRHRFVLILI